MSTRKLDHSEWGPYFDRVSRTLGAKTVTIEVASLAIGDQIVADSIVLNGLTYDRKSDVFEVLTESLDHLVRRPCEIFVEESADGLASIEVIDDEDTRQIIKLSQPLLLTAV